MLIKNNSTARGYTLGSVFIPPGAQAIVPDDFYDEILSISDLALIGSAPANSRTLIVSPISAAFNTDGTFAGLVKPDNTQVNIGLGVVGSTAALGSKARVKFLADSLTQGGQTAKTGPEYQLQFNQTTITQASNLGGITWIPYAMVDGRANGGIAQTVAGTLFTDSIGRVAWQAAGDTVGPYVDVSNGGWPYLKSGTFANSGITLAVRGATAPVPNQSSTVQTAGFPVINDYNLIGHVAFVAGAFGDTFYDYEAFAIAGCTSADALKFAPQAFVTPTEATVIMVGVNDLPTTDDAVKASAANIKGIIDIASAKSRRVYIHEIWPNPSATTAVNKNYATVSQIVKAYCDTKPNVKFISAYGRMVNPNTLTVGGNTPLSNPGGKTGVFNAADNLHTNPYGAWLGALPTIEAMSRDFPIVASEYTTLDTWNPVAAAGSLNVNPTLRGVGGTVTGSVGITGTAPDSWTLNRTGAAQLCTTSFKPAADGGLDWYSMAVSGAAATGEFHELTQIVPLPTGVVAGDYVQLVGEFCILSTTGNGLATVAFQAAGSGNLQLPYLVQTSRPVANFTTEQPILRLRGTPMEVLPGVTSFTLRLRVGCAYVAATSGAGDVGTRKFRFEKCAPTSYT